MSALTSSLKVTSKTKPSTARAQKAALLRFFKASVARVSKRQAGTAQVLVTLVIEDPRAGETLSILRGYPPGPPYLYS